MSVLSRPALHRPTLHRATAPTQREGHVPLPRTPSGSEGTATTRPSQITRPAPQPDRRTRATMIVGGGLAVALAIGVGTYTLLEDDGSSTVIAPSVTYVPGFGDLGRDAAAAARAADAAAAAGVPVPGFDVATAAEQRAALAQRLRNSGEDATAVSSGSTTASDAARLSEAQRDAALARRAQSIPE